MTPNRATNTKVVMAASSLFLLASLSACGKDEIKVTCDEPQPYQAVVAGKRVVSPDGINSLDEFKEMPIPQADSPPRPKGARCIESPPSILTGGTINK